MIHPWERFNGTNTKHYPDFKYVQNEVANAKEVFFPQNLCMACLMEAMALRWKIFGMR